MHTCAIRIDNKQVQCWGSAGSLSQNPPDPNQEYKFVRAMESGTCGLKSDNTAECFGNLFNDKWLLWYRLLFILGSVKQKCETFCEKIDNEIKIN